VVVQTSLLLVEWIKLRLGLLMAWAKVVLQKSSIDEIQGRVGMGVGLMVALAANNALEERIRVGVGERVMGDRVSFRGCRK